jgi:hypothetical protein
MRGGGGGGGKILPFVTSFIKCGIASLELLLEHDDFLFCKADGLHYEINSIGISSDYLLFLMRSAHE